MVVGKFSVESVTGCVNAMMKVNLCPIHGSGDGIPRWNVRFIHRMAETLLRGGLYAMRNDKHGLTMAAREHIAAGNPITRLEALVFFGLSNLTDMISELRKQGWIIKSRPVPFAAAVKRVNEHAVLKPPANLPTREIVLTEYWLSR